MRSDKKSDVKKKTKIMIEPLQKQYNLKHGSYRERGQLSRTKKALKKLLQKMNALNNDPIFNKWIINLMTLKN